jgi:iron complex outermembrane receptor protein
VNARLLFTPTSDIELDAKAHYGYDRAGAVAYNAIFQIPALVTAFNDPIFNENANDHQFIFTNNFAPQSHQATDDGSLKFSDSLGFATAVASVAFSRVESDYAAGGTSGAFGFFDGSPSCINTRAATAGVVEPAPFTVYQTSFGFAQPYAPNTCDGTQYEQRIDRTVTTEIRLLSSQDSELTWQGGLSYVNTHEDACTTLELNTGVGAAYTCYSTNPAYHTEQMEDDTYESKVFAAFGSADYSFTPKFRIGLALRYDIEQLNAVNDVPTDGRTLYVGNVLTGHPNGTATVPANYYLNPGLDPAYNPSGVLPPRSTRFTQLEPKITLSYLANPDLSLFADWGIGFKGGGFNPGGTTEIINGYFNAPVAVGSIDHGVDAGLTVSDQYKKETTSAFEAGLKGKLFDRVTYELTGYYTRVSNMQYFEFFVGPFGQLRVITNIDRVNIAGFEGSARVRLLQGWSIFATGNLTDSTIEKYTARPYTVGNEAPYTPHYTANAGTEFTTPITEKLNLTFRTDARLTGPTPFSPVQNNTVPTIFGLDANFENSIRAAYATVNARLGIDNPRWSVFAYGTNIFNKQYLADVVPAPEFGGSFISPGPLRRFGIEFSVKN